MKNNMFIERSIVGALAFLKESLFAEEYALRYGFMQSLDPRAKIIGIMMFIAAILFTRSIRVIIVLYGVCLLLAFFSRIHLLFFLKRTWVFIPIFSVCIALPAFFSIVTPGEPLWSIQGAGFVLTVTKQGFYGAILFIARVTASVSCAILVSITTRHFVLLKALRVFGIPSVFVMTLGMCYRYIFLFLNIVENTYSALKSRVGGKVHYTKGQHIVAWNISSLWYRSYQLQESVYHAMLSRGYRGEAFVFEEFRMKSRDWLWLVAVSLLVTGVLLKNVHIL